MRLASAPVGIVVGLWVSQLMVPPRYPCPHFVDCAAVFAQPRFPTWVCALIGAGAAALLLIISSLVRRLPFPP